MGFCGIHTFDGIGGARGLQGISWEAREGGQCPWAVLRVRGGDVAMCQEGGKAAIFLKGWGGAGDKTESIRMGLEGSQTRAVD